MDPLHGRSKRRRRHVGDFARRTLIEVRLDAERTRHVLDVGSREPVPPTNLTRRAVVVEALATVNHALLHTAPVHRLAATQIAHIAHTALDRHPARCEVLGLEGCNLRLTDLLAGLAAMLRIAAPAAVSARAHAPVVRRVDLEVGVRHLVLLVLLRLVLPAFASRRLVRLLHGLEPHASI